MAVFLSPGVFPVEIDLSVLPAATGALTPAFIGTANKGPLQVPTFVANAQQFIDIFGNPFPESFLGYAVLAFFEEGGGCWVVRVGVECELGQPADLASICIDNSGSRTNGWGRIAVFTGIDNGRLCSRVISADVPLHFHQAGVSNINYNDIDGSASAGITNATLTFPNPNGYTGSIDDNFTVLITSDVPISSASVLAGATYEVIRNSDGQTILAGVLAETAPGSGISTLIDAGDGIQFHIVVTGSVPLGVQDTFSFQETPDNRKFAFNVDRAGMVTEYTIPDGSTYTTAAAFAAAFNAIISNSEEYIAIAEIDGTVCFTTKIAGQNIQLVATEPFALAIGQALYAYDIPRSYLQSTVGGPYIISTDNNRITIQVGGQAATVSVDFSLPLGTQTPAALAASINVGGVFQGVRYWRSYSMLVPGGFEEVFIETVVGSEFDNLFLQADLSHIKSLRFAETLGILYPYKRNYRSFHDQRVTLPETGLITPANPLSCEQNPLSSQCSVDSAYFENIVGFLVATSAGTWINQYVVTMETFTAGEGMGDTAGRFVITIEDLNGNQIEQIQDVNFDTTSARYIGNVINAGTPLGGVNGNLFLNWIPRPSFLNNDPIGDPGNYQVRIPGALERSPFIGAADGIPLNPAFSSALDQAIIGNPNKATGIFSLQNPERFDITLLIIPGASSGAVIGQGLQMCEARGDVMMIVDPPFGLRAQQVVDWHNGILFSDLRNAINSSYGALYHPWLKIFDQFSGGSIFIPPSGHVSSVYARTARVAETWFAPAGLNRGHLLTPIDLEVDLTQTERDLMYGSGNAVNPIVNFPQDGITVFGQRTLQRIQSARDRVNVRLLLIFIKKNATRLLRAFLFEPNDAVLRAQVVSASNPFLADIQARRGLTGFSVVCDERNNTPESIDRNELHVAYFLKPTRAAEFIQLNLVILRTDASFTADEVLLAGGVSLVTTTP